MAFFTSSWPISSPGLICTNRSRMSSAASFLAFALADVLGLNIVHPFKIGPLVPLALPSAPVHANPGPLNLLHLCTEQPELARALRRTRAPIREAPPAPGEAEQIVHHLFRDLLVNHCYCELQFPIVEPRTYPNVLRLADTNPLHKQLEAHRLHLSSLILEFTLDSLDRRPRHRLTVYQEGKEEFVEHDPGLRDGLVGFLTLQRKLSPCLHQATTHGVGRPAHRLPVVVGPPFPGVWRAPVIPSLEFLPIVLLDPRTLFLQLVGPLNIVPVHQRRRNTDYLDSVLLFVQHHSIPFWTIVPLCVAIPAVPRRSQPSRANPLAQTPAVPSTEAGLDRHRRTAALCSWWIPGLDLLPLASTTL